MVAVLTGVPDDTTVASTVTGGSGMSAPEPAPPGRRHSIVWPLFVQVQPVPEAETKL